MMLTAMGQHILDFWLNLCVCQSLIVDPEATGDTLYQVRGRDTLHACGGAGSTVALAWRLHTTITHTWQR